MMNCCAWLELKDCQKEEKKMLINLLSRRRKIQDFQAGFLNPELQDTIQEILTDIEKTLHGLSDLKIALYSICADA